MQSPRLPRPCRYSETSATPARRIGEVLIEFVTSATGRTAMPNSPRADVWCQSGAERQDAGQRCTIDEGTFALTHQLLTVALPVEALAAKHPPEHLTRRSWIPIGHPSEGKRRDAVVIEVVEDPLAVVPLIEQGRLGEGPLKLAELIGYSPRIVAKHAVEQAIDWNTYAGLKARDGRT